MCVPRNSPMLKSHPQTNMNEDEKCYIYKGGISKSSSKNSKLNIIAPKSSSNSSQSKDPARQLREELCRETWNIQRYKIQSVLDEANSLTLNEITQFLQEESSRDDLIRTGYVLAGPDTTSHASFFSQLAQQISDDEERSVISISPNVCLNLKNALRSIIRNFINDDDDFADKITTRYLDYDLERLHLWSNFRRKKLMVIAFEDSESFHSSVLSDIIDQISVWQDRMPFVLLFGIATSIDVFQERLPQSAIRNLSGQQFKALQSQELLERIFSCTIVGGDIPVRIGPNLAKAILRRPKEYIQNPHEFIDSFQYAYMCHFYSNPLTVFLRDELTEQQIDKDLFDKIRYTTSFQKLVERHVEMGDHETSESLLDSNTYLLNALTKEIRTTQRLLEQMTAALQMLEVVRKFLLPAESLSNLSIISLQGNLMETPLYRQFILALKKTDSDQFSTLLDLTLPWIADKDAEKVLLISNHLSSLVQSCSKMSLPLKSKYDVRNSTMRTSVIAQKIELSIHKASISEDEKNFSQLLDEYIGWTNEYMTEHVYSMDEVSFSEIIFYDNVHPDSTVFLPKARPAMERALTNPHDYLDCDCCGYIEQGTLSPTQPATALLYQLCQESGSRINVSDLWTAFIGVLGEDQDEKQAIFLFQRALAELRYFGMFKSTKKKADDIIRTMWRGL